MKTTKELARDLGLLRKRTSLNQQDKNVKKVKRTGQIFQYLIVIDFESTCWENSKYRSQEIIEFPAVLLNTLTGKIENEFHYYVMPQEQPTLSDFCKNLTGISQAMVEDGIPLSMCLNRFNHWLTKIADEKHIVYNTHTGNSIDFNLCTFVTWSDWDLSVCLQYECRRKQLRKHAALNSWVDLRATYKNFYERKPNGLNGALQDVGIEFEGRQHSGLDDAKNTAKLAWRMMCDGCIIKITKSLDSAPSGPTIKSHLTTVRQNTGSSCAPTTIGTGNTRELLNKTPTNMTTFIGANNAGGVVLPPNMLSSKVHQMKGHQKMETLENQKSTYGPNNRGPSSDTETSTSKSITTDTMQATKSHETALHQISNCTRNQVITQTVPSIPKEGLNYDIRNFITPQPVLKRPHESKQVPNTGFKTPNTCSNQGKHGAAYTFPLAKKPTIINSSTKPSSSASPYVYSTMKATPPMCSCGKRSKRCMAQTPGPNMGRMFFSCPNGRKSEGFGKKSGCGFFKWEKETPKIRSAPVLKSYSGNIIRFSSHSAQPCTPIAQPCTPIAQPNFNSPSTIDKSVTQKKSLGVRNVGMNKIRF
ncbi:unnamed protein product [Owenia fusiformis]|uniref:ERI1 exoribonuclease 2 n=1 Tax=Owenia fusiformis TaxID=6347 RepID=A0A8J1U689_OWEFU|nr:unnamed protein product [Owenia fusiformis]